MYAVKVPSELLDAHECEALVLTCMDFRFWEATLTNFVKENLGVARFDVANIPGVCQGLANGNEMLASYTKYVIQLAVEKHHIKRVILIHHTSCGAYGISDTEQELKTQTEDLKKADAILGDLFPELSFSLFFAQRGDGKINYRPIP